MRRQSLLIDSNLLVLLIVGAASPTYISMHKRLKAFTVEDYGLLVDLIAQYRGAILTPHTLTESYNLAASIAEPARTRILAQLALFIDRWPERYVTARIGCRHAAYVRLGLVDAMLMAVMEAQVGGRRPVLLTTDLDLFIAAAMAGYETINFNHLRDY